MASAGPAEGDLIAGRLVCDLAVAVTAERGPAVEPYVAAGCSRRAAVLGSPIGHSLSPFLHRAAYATLGLDWRYDAIECDSAGLAALFDRLDDSFVGLSLTMPLKRTAVPLLDEVSPLAAAVGAVNTVTFDGDGPSRRRRGDNTDIGGLLAAISTARTTKSASAALMPLERVAILGAGGTAAAAVGAAHDLGVRRVSVVVRDQGRAGELLAAADRVGAGVDLVGWPGIGALRDADLVISTVPAGASDVLAREWTPRPEQLLLDVVYHPWPTPLAEAAAAAGAQVVGGLELLVQQAALQVERWTGQPSPVDAMRAAGERALRGRADQADRASRIS
ncbi:MAG: shikimate dehydrogenase [Acidothermaceae bacterium]